MMTELLLLCTAVVKSIETVKNDTQKQGRHFTLKKVAKKITTKQYKTTPQKQHHFYLNIVVLNTWLLQVVLNGHQSDVAFL